MKISLILPTYNEKENIIDLIETLILLLNKERYDFEIIVVDDNSPDGTLYLVKEQYYNYPYVKCIVREKERGLASALKTGILHSQGEIIVLMDTDFNHDPFKVPEMISLLPRYEVVSGSRYILGGGMLGPQYRYWGSYFFNFFIRLIMGVKTTDNLSGFVAFRRNILDNFNLDKIFYGYGDYYIRFLYRVKQLDLNTIEIPVIYKIRYAGDSKTIFLKYLLKYIFTVIKIFLCPAK